MFSSRGSVMVKLLSDPSTTKFVRRRASCSSDSATECHPVTKITLHLPPNRQTRGRIVGSAQWNRWQHRWLFSGRKSRLIGQLEWPQQKVVILSIGCRGRSNIVNHDSPSMLDKWPVFPEKTRFLTEKVEGLLPEKEPSFAELLRCRTCWLRSMVAIRTQSLDVVPFRMLRPLRRGVPNRR